MINTVNYWIHNNSLIFKPHFNEPLENFYQVVTDYETLIFANYNELNVINCIDNVYDAEVVDYIKTSKFNYPITKLHNNLKKLSLGFNYNKCISLNDGIKIVIFGDSFNCPVKLVETIEELYFGESFNQPIVFNYGLKKLTLGYSFNQSIDLPSSIKYLMLECNN